MSTSIFGNQPYLPIYWALGYMRQWEPIYLKMNTVWTVKSYTTQLFSLNCGFASNSNFSVFKLNIPFSWCKFTMAPPPRKTWIFILFNSNSTWHQPCAVAVYHIWFIKMTYFAPTYLTQMKCTYKIDYNEELYIPYHFVQFNLYNATRVSRI